MNPCDHKSPELPAGMIGGNYKRGGGGNGTQRFAPGWSAARHTQKSATHVKLCPMTASAQRPRVDLKLLAHQCLQILVFGTYDHGQNNAQHPPLQQPQRLPLRRAHDLQLFVFLIVYRYPPQLGGKTGTNEPAPPNPDDNKPTPGAGNSPTGKAAKAGAGFQQPQPSVRRTRSTRRAVMKLGSVCALKAKHGLYGWLHGEAVLQYEETMGNAGTTRRSRPACARNPRAAEAPW